MSDWSSEQYLKFKEQRTQPAIDLANRLRGNTFERIVDIGCGPGNSTAVLKSVFPNARLVGIDSSPNMIEKAKKSYPDLTFEQCDAHLLKGEYDLLFSNACFQWIPDHEVFLPGLMEKLRPGGILAVQMPMNEEEPLFQIIHEIAEDPQWGFQDVWFETHKIPRPDGYFRILSGCSESFEMWETVYYHRMPSHTALLDWVKGTRLRPYLEQLDETKVQKFERAILDRVLSVYPRMENGEVILRFRRFFFLAQKK